MLRRSIATTLLVLAVSGCSALAETDSESNHATQNSEQENIAPEETSSRPDVPWSDYGPVVKKRIDRLAKTENCTGLQREFDNADANSDATMSRTGHSNADLMDYIDAQMQEAGCY